MNAATDTRPVITFTYRLTKDGLATGPGWKTSKGASNAAARINYDNATATVVEVDGAFFVDIVTAIQPGQDTTTCTDCGAGVPTISTGEGHFDGENCPAATSRMFPRHRVDGDVFRAAKEYRSAQFGIINGDTRYAVAE